MKVYHALMKTLRAIVTGILAVDVFIVTAQIFWRFVLKSPIGWSEQICRLLFLWAIMLGIPVVFYEKCDLVFNVLFEKFSPKLQKSMTNFFCVLAIAFSVFYMSAGLDLCMKTGLRLTSGIKMPYLCLYGAQPICALLLVLVFGERLIETLKGTNTPKEDEK